MVRGSVTKVNPAPALGLRPGLGLHPAPRTKVPGSATGSQDRDQAAATATRSPGAQLREPLLLCLT